MQKQPLLEFQNPSNITHELMEEETVPGSGVKQKNLYMKGIFIQGNVRNANQRVYPFYEIKRAVEAINTQLRTGKQILGELDHPDDLKLNLDRVSHMITEMWIDGFNGLGKLKVLPTPMGNIAKALTESGVNLGVSSRGSGNVNESDGSVSDFEIITVDIVATPSAPNAYPQAIYEGMMNMKHGYKGIELARDAYNDAKTQKYLKEFVTSLIKDLKVTK